MSPARLGLSVVACVLSLSWWSRAEAPFLFSIRGAYRTAESGPSEALAFVNLAVPFDAWLSPQLPQDRDPSPLGTASSSELPVTEPESTAPRTGFGETQAAESAEVPRATVQPPPSELLLDSGIVRATVKRALSVAESARTSSRLRSLSARARSSALLPELRLRGGRSTDQSLRLSPTIDDPLRYTQTGGADLFFEASLTWRLNRLVFANEELSVERLLRQARDEDLRVIQRVLAALYRLQRAAFSESDDLLSPLELGKARLERLQAELELDVWTDGWFSAALSRWTKQRRDAAATSREVSKSQRSTRETPPSPAPPSSPAPESPPQSDERPTPVPPPP